MVGLSYTKGRTDVPLLEMTIGALFDQTLKKNPDQEAVISRHEGVRYNWREFGEIVDQLAKALLSIGLEKGDRLGIWAPNCSRWLFMQMATSKIGVILVNINPAYRLNELNFVLADSQCRWLVTEATFKTSNYHAMLNELIPELEQTAVGELNNEAFPYLEGIITLGEEPDPGMLAWNDLMARADQTSDKALQQAVDLVTDFHDPINIQYTSGTTGFPKGASLSHHNILNNGYMVGESLRFTDQDRIVIPVPLFHCFGMVMGNLGAITHGSTIIYPSDGFDPLLTLDAVEEERATALYGVPTMFIAMLTQAGLEERDFSTLRTGIMAGTTCPIEIMRHVINSMNMSEVQICYGMTETSPVSIQTAHDDNLEKRTTTVGRTQPHLENKIIDDEGVIVPRGEIGVLCTRGYSVMLGYWRNPEETAIAIDDEGWMNTGDLAIMDEDGYVQIVGRNTDMIIRGGENIYPRELEEFLITHPQIADVNVIGLPSEKFGEEVEAWIRVLDNAPLTKEDVIAFCEGKISHFKIPRYVKFVDEFPMTLSGKVQKYLMREISVKERNLKEH